MKPMDGIILLAAQLYDPNVVVIIMTPASTESAAGVTRRLITCKSRFVDELLATLRRGLVPKFLGGASAAARAGVSRRDGLAHWHEARFTKLIAQ